MKIKILLASIAMAVSANASAAILSPIEAGGLSEAVFSIWDPTTNQSYSQDLGTTWQTFRDNLSNNAFSISYNISDVTLYNAALGTSSASNLLWNVSVANGQDANFANFEDFGVISTSNLGNAINSAALTQAINQHDAYATALRGTTTPVNNDPALNDAYFGTIANGGYAGTDANWGTSWNTNNATNNSASFGTDLDFYYWRTGGFSPNPTVTRAAGSWSFDGNTIAYAAPSTVPVPAAAWLMASGLLGLVGVARRKKSEV